MPGKPKISVITPTYNRKDKLAKLLESLINQEKPVDSEIIVVVDGSSDGTVEFLKDYSRQHDMIKYIYIPNSGRSVARNKGAEIAQAGILAFIDDDCIADRMWLSNISKYFEDHPETDMVHGPVESTLPEMPPFVHSVRLKNMESKGVFAIKKEVFKKLGGFDSVLSYWAEDLDFFLCARKNDVNIAYDDSIIIQHPPRVRGFKYLKNIITIKGWFLIDYIVRKNPSIKIRNTLKNETIRALAKLALVIPALALFPFFFNLIVMEAAFFFIASFYTIRTLIKIMALKEDLKIPLIDIFTYCLIGWTCNFMNILTFIISRFYRNPYIVKP